MRLHLMAATAAVFLVAPFLPAEDNSEARSRLEETLGYLASDELEGRGVGTEGIEKAADFLVEELAKLGLKTEKQAFELITSSELGPAESNQLVLEGPVGAAPGGEASQRIVLEVGREFQPLALGGNAEFEAPLVFVGYGITAPDQNYDDYEDIDAKDKVVVILRKEPQQDNEESEFAGKDSSRHAYFSTKVANAAEHGAAGVILVNDFFGLAQSRERARTRWHEAIDDIVEKREAFLELEEPTAEQQASHEKEITELVEQISELNKRLQSSFDEVLTLQGAGPNSEHDDFPVLFALRESLDPIFQQAVGKDLQTIEAEIDDGPTPQSFDLTEWTAVGQTQIVRNRATVENVIGVLEGSGPRADETVVIGAHYDHLGMGGPGSLAPWTKEIHNGADDNASGTVALLEVARRLSTGDPPPRRVVFIAFAGEERGLLGSTHYVDNPLFPLEKTVAMLNMDMVGRLKDNKLTVHGTGTATQFDGMLDEWNKKYEFEIARQPSGFGPSDHAVFYGKKIPVLHFFTGTHSDYHRPSDDPDKINFKGLARITSLVTDAATAVIQLEEPLEYKETPRRRRGR